jgi:hypothetical protein
LHPLLDTEAHDVDFFEISEECQETKEIIEVVPVGEGFSEDTNSVGNQGKPQSIYTHYFQ